MKKLVIIFLFLLPFLGVAQIRPTVDAGTFDGFDLEYFLDTTDFAVTKVWYVDVGYIGDQLSNGTIFAPFTAIQQAFDSCAVGDIVLAYPGTYPAEHLHPIIDSIDLRSLSGASQTFVGLTASGGTGFDMDSEGMTISGFTFTGDAGFLVQLEGGEDAFTLTNCVIDTEGSPSIGLNIGASGCSNMIVENNKFISETADGAIWMEKNVTNPLIRNNWFIGSDSASSYAIQTAGSTDGRYINNLIEGYASGIFLHTVTTTSGGTANELIANNIIRNCSKAIRLGNNAQTVDMDSIFVFTNTLYYNSFAIFISDDGNVLSGTFEVVGNVINDNTVSIRNDGTVPVYLANWIDGGITMSGALDVQNTITTGNDAANIPGQIKGIASDGDASNLLWNTSDQVVVNDASGGFVVVGMLGAKTDVVFTPEAPGHFFLNTSGATLQPSVIVERSAPGSLPAPGGGSILFRNRNFSGGIGYEVGAIGVINTNDVVGNVDPAMVFKVGDGTPVEAMRLDVDLGTTLTGSLLIGTTTVYTPNTTTASGTSVADDAAITVTHTIMRMVGADAEAILDTDPAINDGVADGQIVYIFGTADANLVTIADAVNTQLAGGISMTLGIGDNLVLMWDDGSSLWREVSRSDN